jgi:hypothetical protein
MFGFHGFQLGLASGFGFEAGLSVGIDGLFGKVVGSAAGWRGWMCQFDTRDWCPTGPGRWDYRLNGVESTYRYKGSPNQSCQLGNELFVSFVAPDMEWAHIDAENRGRSAYQVDLI